MVAIPWGDERSLKFITNVGLITSDGPHGKNIMACEWTHHISYNPGLIAVCVRDECATADNIRATKEFGVSLAAVDQNVLSSIAGGYGGKSVDKIKALDALGFSLYPGTKIKALMVKDAALNVECKLTQELNIGTHLIFIGEALEATANDKEPLAYHQGKYWQLTEELPKPSQEERDAMKETVTKFRK